MTRLFWVHTDCLRRIHEQGAIFVFDPQQIEREGWGIKRLLFLYECLLEAPDLQILKGDSVELLSLESAAVITEATPDPWIASRIQALQARGTNVEVRPAPPFSGIRADASLTRFSRYWKKAGPKLLRL
jgi:hypothetical protein